MQKALLYGLAMTASLTVGSAASRADGPCTNDIAQLSRQLGGATGLGAPVSEPAAGLATGNASGQGATSLASAAASDRAQHGGASLTGGGSPGTVGGVSGPAGAAAGGGARDAIASGQVATSAEDVRRQSEGKPTMAQQAALDHGKPSSTAGTDQADQTSRAKMALQRAVDLNAKGDTACAAQVSEARGLMPKH